MSKKQSSFWIPRRAVEILLDQQASALDICAYLTLASHTDCTGMATTAGAKKIKKATGAPGGYGKNKGMAGEAIERLLNSYGSEDKKPAAKKRTRWGEGYHPECLQRLLYTVDDYTRMTGILFPTLPGFYQYSYVLNTFGADQMEDGVWFSRELVDGTGHFKHPLKRLKAGGNIAARLLLKLQEVQTRTIIGYGGVRPYGGVYAEYDGYLNSTSHGFSFWQFKEGSDFVYPPISLPVLGLKFLSDNEETEKRQLKPFWQALTYLEESGFIQQVVTVFDDVANKKNACPLYELTVKNKHGHIAKEDAPYLLRPRVDRLFEIFSLLDDIVDARGRHLAEPVIVRTMTTPHVAGVYRTRFRPADYRQYSVKDTHLTRAERKEEWMEELNILEEMADRTL